MTPDASFREDLEADSLDLVELIMKLNSWDTVINAFPSSSTQENAGGERLRIELSASRPAW